MVLAPAMSRIPQPQNSLWPREMTLGAHADSASDLITSTQAY
jgi:hypothetical protein